MTDQEKADLLNSRIRMARDIITSTAFHDDTV
jgi:hypothetical protein